MRRFRRRGDQAGRNTLAPRRPGRRVSLAQALEPRMMFDAAGVATAAEALQDQAAQDAAAALRPDTDATAHDTSHDDSAALVDTTPADDQDDADAGAVDGAAPAAAADRREVAFIDTRVDGWQTLAAGLAADVEIVVLDAGEDGLAQIADWVAAQSGAVDAIHIISEGNVGEIWIGATALSDRTIEDHAGDLAAIGAGLAEGADILLYGCDVAGGPEGSVFLGRLSELTGADVAASDDATGGITANDGGRHGDWQLEVATGTIETTIALTAEAQAGYDGILATFTAANASQLNTAITNANAAGGTDTIDITADISTTAGFNTITDTVIVKSSTGDIRSITGTSISNDALFAVSNATATFQDLALSGGNNTSADNSGNGGAISFVSNANHSLTIERVTFSSNQGVRGGAVYFDDGVTGTGSLTITDATFSDSTALAGGAVWVRSGLGTVTVSGSTFDQNEGTSGSSTEGGGALMIVGDTAGDMAVNIDTSYFSGNTTASYGGAVFFKSGHVYDISITRSTFSGNTASSQGGAINMEGTTASTAEVVNSTFSGNSAQYGGAIENSLTLAVSHSTFAGNVSTAGSFNGTIDSYGGSLAITHSIFANNTGRGINVTGGSVSNGGYNIYYNNSVASGGWTAAGTDKTTDPVLGTLQDNGGATPTMLPGSGSSAIDAGNPSISGAPATDQRGGTRVSGSAIDIGAVELVNDTTPVLGGPQTVFWTEGNAPTVILPVVTVADDDGDLITSARVWIANARDGDVLAITAPGPYTSSVAMEGGALVLTLTGSGTAAQMQAALRTITYSSTADAPTWGNTGSAYTPTAAGSRILRATVTDADGATSDELIGSGIAVTSLDDDAPALAAEPYVYTPGSGYVTVAPDLFLIDDTATMTSATVQLVSSPDGFAERPRITATDPSISISYNTSTKTLTFTGTASLDAYQTLLRQVQYQNTSTPANIDPADRTLRYTVTDANDQVGTFDLTIGIDVAPTVATNTGATVAEGGSDTITTAMLQATDDFDAADSVTYTLTGTNGLTVYRDGVDLASNGTFTQKDIDDGLITVEHDGGESAGSFTFVLSQGSGLSDSVPHTFDVTTTPVNDAPVITLPAGSSVSGTEDTVFNLTSTYITVSDADAGTSPVVVTITSTDGTLGSIGTTTDVTVGSTANGLTLTGTVAAINAYLGEAGNLNFTPPANVTGNRTISIGISDQGNTGTGGTLTDSDTLTINLAAVNDAPVISGDGIDLPDGTEHTGTGTIAIADLLTDAGYSDADTGALSGIAITGVTGNSVWQYTTDGTNWFQISAVSDGSAILLSASASLRYVSDFENGETATISFRAWDQTSGTATNGSTQFRANTATNGGSSAFSANVATATIVLTDLNDAPSISPDDVPLTDTDEDTTSAVVTVSDLLTDAGYGDVDNGASAGGIALTGSAGNGTWQYSTDSGANWFDVGSVAWGTALLLKPDAQLRYVPDGDNGESASLTFKGWDQTQGTAADGATRSTYNITTAGGLTAFSFQQADATITVTSVNDAPVVTVPGSIAVTEDVATALTGIAFADVDVGSGTVVVTLSVASGALAATSGGSVTVGGTASALTLTGTIANINSFIAASGVSFTTAANATADVTLTVGIDDGGNTGSGGAQTDSDTVTLSVTAVQDAPVISGDGIDLPDGTEQTGTGTIAIADLLTDAGYSDADTGALSGIAITGVTGNSIWQYTTDGTNWFQISAVSGSSAILLDASASLRYVPDFENGETATISFRAWDQTSGTATNGSTQFRANTATNGGSTAFSANVATATIVLTDVNDSPSISPDDVPLTGTDEDTTSAVITVSDLLTDAGYDDADIGASAGGIALTGSAGNGTWQYSTDSGANWFDVGAVSWGAALLLKPDAQLRYVPDGDNGESASLTFKGWDQTEGTAADGATRSTYNITTSGGLTAFSFQEADATITVTSVNDAPVISPDDVTLTGTDRETRSDPVTISDLLTDAGYGDVDTGALSGIAITGLTGNGTWAYTTDGTNWFSVGTVSGSAALLLGATAQLRYTPDGVNPETATINFKAWDQTSGTATSGASRSTADTSTDGGTTAFSSDAATAELAVVANNEAPVLTAPATLTVSEDTDSPLTGISIADADDAGQDYLLIITADSGSFAATGTADVDVVAEGHSIRLTGSMADLNDFIAAGNVTFRTAPNATQAVTLDVSVSDQDAAVPETDTASIAVTVTPVNDAPDVYTVDDGVTLAPALEPLFSPLLVLDAPDGGYYAVSIRTDGPDADNNVLIYRYDADGALDQSYGTGGVAFFAGSVLDAVTVQADGQLLIAAHSADGDVGLFRVATNGTVDASFGPAIMTDASYDLVGADIEIDSAGKIFVTTQGTPTAGLRATFIYRFSADGVFEAKLDASGDIAGNEVGLDSIIQPDGKIVTVARRGDDLIVFRQNADGTLDTSFATVGYTVIDSTVDASYDALLGLQADGSILLAVPTQGDNPLAPTPMIWRFTSDGALDTSFGTDGSITGPAMDGLSFAFAPDGGILVTGTINDDGVLSAALLRYTADGLPDGDFGRGGEIRIGGIGYNVAGTSLQVNASTGDILLGGAYLGETLGADSALLFARFDASGQAIEGAAPVDYTENGTPVVIAPTIAIDDVDLGDADTLDGFTVTLSRDGSADGQDEFSAADGGSLDALTEGEALVVSGTTIGTVVTNSAGTLVLSLNAAATRALVNEALRQVAYANGSDTPPATVDLVWTVDDGNSGAQGTGGSATGTMTSAIAITAVNDVPAITVPGGGTLSVVEDTETPITGISFSDADAGSATVEVEFAVDYGVLSATSGSGVTVTATDSQTIVLSGSIADINTFIANGEVTYQTDPDDTGDVNLTVTIDDLGNTGPAPETASEVIVITVDPVNDAPDIDTLPDGVVVDDNPGGIDGNPIIIPIPSGGYYQIGADTDGTSSEVIIARYTAAGELDTSYGTNGIATLSDDGTDISPIDAVVQADGSLVVASTFDDGTISGSLILRFDTSGTRDPSFAQGGPGLIVADMTLDDSGRILLTGGQIDSGTGETDGVIVRLTSAGEIDLTFTLVQYDAGGDELFTGVTVQADGSIVVVGMVDDDVIVQRYAADGTLDTGFGTGGTVTFGDSEAIEITRSVMIQADGGIIVAGTIAGPGGYAAFLYRLDSTGTVDTSFGTSGWAAFPGLIATSFTMLDDGSVVAVAYDLDAVEPLAIILRIGTDGQQDMTFGTDGRLVLGDATRAFLGTAISTDADGNLLIGGLYIGCGCGDAEIFAGHFDANGVAIDGFGDRVHVEDGGFTAVDPYIDLYDAELAAGNNYDGATLTITRDGGANGDDTFGAVSGGTLGALVEGDALVVDGVTIGTVVTNAGGTLVLVFNANATYNLVNEAAQQIGYATTNDTPPASVDLAWTLNDGNTGAQGTGPALSGSVISTIRIAAANDAPVLTLPGSGTIAVTEDVASAVTGITIADVDAAGGIVTVTFAIGAGTLTASSGSGVTVGGTDTALTLTGSITDINAFIAAEGVSYTTAGNAVDDVTLTVTVDDGGNTGAGGALADSGTVTLDIQPVNDAPEIVDLPDAISTGDAGNGPVSSIEVITLADGRYYVIGYDAVPYTFQVARYNADGTLDTSFDGDGGVTTDLGSSIIPVDAAIQADGKLVVMGRPASGSGPVTLVRYNTDGSLDTSFGTDGIATTAIPGSNGQARAVAIDVSGDILVTGNTNNNFLLMRFDADGTLDTGFGGGDGVVDIDLGGLDWGFVITPQTDGKLIVGGNTDLGGALIRLNADGSLDTGFGTGGVVELGDSGSLTTIEDVFVQSDGKVVAVGFVATVPFATTIWRLNTDGSTDTGYGTAGQLNLSSTTKNDAFMTAADEMVILTTRSVGGETVSTLIRVGDDGALDSGFGTGGELQLAELADRDLTAWNIGLRADGGMVLAGPVDISTGEVFTARIDADGNFVGGVGIDDHIEDGDATAIGADIRIADVELDAADSYAGATLTLTRDGGTSTDDAFSAVSGGTLSALVESGDITVGGVVVGTVTTNSGGQLVLTFNADATAALVNQVAQQIAYANGSDTPPDSVDILWSLNDGNSGDQGKGGALIGTVVTTIGIIATNDAPVVTVPLSINVTEDIASAITGVSVSDIDAGTGVVTVTFHVPSGSGTISATSDAGVTVGGTANTCTLTGTITDINAFISAENVTFTTAADATADVTMTVTVNDDGNTGTGGALTDSDTITLAVTAVNDAPVITAPDSATIAVTEDVASALTGISFADVDAGSSVVTVTLSVASGTLAATSGSGVTVGGTASALTLTGSITDINAFIAASNVGFTTAANDTTDVVLTVAIDDGGFSGSGGAQTDSATITLDVTPVNDAPVITDLSASPVYQAGGAAVAVVGSAALSDVDSTMLTSVVLTLTTRPGGTSDYMGLFVPAANYANDHGISYNFNASTGTLTLSGTASLADYQTVLQGAAYLYTGASATMPAGDRVVTITVTDDSGDTPTQTSTAFERTIEVDSAPTVDTNTGTTVDEGGSTTITAAMLSSSDVEDPDAADITYTLTTPPPAGTLKLDGVALATGDTFTQQDIDDGLVTYEHDGSETTSDSFGFSVKDTNGLTVSGQSFALTVTAVNDAPALTAPASIDVTEDTETPLTGISITDADAASGTVTVTFTVGEGALAATGTADITVGGTASALTLTGTVSDINAFISGGALTFTPDANANGDVTLSIDVDDSGNSGSGGAKTDTATVTLAVAAVNDAPDLTAPASIAVTEDTVTALTGISISDIDAGSGIVTVTFAVGSGTLSATS
ncbi:DUF4347 domain-containing protein, partial [Tistrella arctica]